jgi:hypothetical protein
MRVVRQETVIDLLPSVSLGIGQALAAHEAKASL